MFTIVFSLLAVAGSAAPKDASPRSTTALLTVGSAAPAVPLLTHRGDTVSLPALRGKPAVVYFYPKDDTPGCTVEAQGFAASHDELTRAGVRVFGVSTDDADSHRAFADKYDLPFELVMDPDGRVAAAFGVPLKNGYAKRVTFVIGADGRVAKVFPDVDPTGHAREILTVLTPP